MKKKYCVLLLLLLIMVLGTAAPAGAAVTGLNTRKLELANGKKYRLELVGAKAQNVKWTSSKPEIAVISRKGVIKARKNGSTLIIATYRNKTYRCKVTVRPAAKLLRLKKKKLTLYTGETYSLAATVYPRRASQRITWKSSNPKIVKVDKKGKLTVKRTGTVTITAATMDGTKKTARCVITAKKRTVKADIYAVRNSVDGQTVNTFSIFANAKKEADRYADQGYKVFNIKTGKTVYTPKPSGKTVQQKAIEYALAIANDDSHGYGNHYWNPKNPDMDCSMLVIKAYEAAGVPVYSKGGATKTWNMTEPFLQYGFTDVTASVNFNTAAGLRPGDVLLSNGHVEMYIGSMLLVGARNDLDGVHGDSSGLEICPGGYGNNGWYLCLRYTASGNTAPANESTADSPSTDTGTASTDSGAASTNTGAASSGSGDSSTNTGAASSDSHTPQPTYLVQCGVFAVKENAEKQLKAAREAWPEYTFVMKEDQDTFVIHVDQEFSDRQEADQLAIKLAERNVGALVTAK